MAKVWRKYKKSRFQIFFFTIHEKKGRRIHKPTNKKRPNNVPIIGNNRLINRKSCWLWWSILIFNNWSSDACTKHARTRFICTTRPQGNEVYHSHLEFYISYTCYIRNQLWPFTHRQIHRQGKNQMLLNFLLGIKSIWFCEYVWTDYNWQNHI